MCAGAWRCAPPRSTAPCREKATRPPPGRVPLRARSRPRAPHVQGIDGPRCHLFNTFFDTKLYKDEIGYCYKQVSLKNQSRQL